MDGASGVAGPGGEGRDLLAGATIVMEDGRAASYAATTGVPRGPRVTGGPSEGTAPTGAAAPPDSAATGLRPLQLYGGGLLIALCLGLLGWITWRERQPAPVTVRPITAGSAAEIRVQVSGAVATPGVYRLLQGDRVEDAVRAAGGLAPNADVAKLNQAQRVRDEQRLDIPFLPPTEASAASVEHASGTTGTSGAAGGTDSTAVGQRDQAGPDDAPEGAAVPAEATRPVAATPRATATPRPAATTRPGATARTTAAAEPSPTLRLDGKLNVNVATQAQLEKLPGIGAVSAQRIIAFRQANGPITSMDQLRAAGIQESILRRAADFIAFD